VGGPDRPTSPHRADPAHRGVRVRPARQRLASLVAGEMAGHGTAPNRKCLEHVTRAAAQAAAQADGLLLGTPLHPPPGVWHHLLDLLIVNAHQAASIPGLRPEEVLAEPAAAVRGLLNLGPPAAIITLRAAGAVISDAVAGGSRGRRPVRPRPVPVGSRTGQRPA
jgi:sugar/nucleoside kinase (ribokinase family)